LGPTIAGYVFDATGSYRLYVLAAIPMFLAGAALIASLGDYVRHRPPDV
jgi:cyanate permease